MRCIAIVATTIDGRIALDSGHFSDWTSPEDKTFLREMLDKSDVVLGGTKTYSWFLENDLLDELYLTIEPITFGRGLPLFDTSKALETRFKLESSKQLNERGAVLLHYVR